MRGLRQVFAWVWASPYTLLGLGCGVLFLLTGSKLQWRRGVAEFYGGSVQRLLRMAPISPEGALAMTIGHTIFGQTEEALDLARDHEHVHVRQFERWGPFMGPAYFLGSLWSWLRGGRPYRDNPFEREAYDAFDWVTRTQPAREPTPPAAPWGRRPSGPARRAPRPPTQAAASPCPLRPVCPRSRALFSRG